MPRKIILVDFDGEHQYQGAASSEHAMLLGQLIFSVLPPGEVETIEVLDALAQNLLCMSKTLGVKTLDIYDKNYGSCTISIAHPKDIRCK